MTHALDEGLAALIEPHTGPIVHESRAERGFTSDYTGTVEGEKGKVFVKAVRAAGRLASSLEREEAINPHVREFSPPLLWASRDDSWHALGFEHVAARHASFKPGSADLPAVVDVLDRISRTPLPEIARPWTETRYDKHAPEGTAGLLKGQGLLHGDINPDNILIGDSGKAQVVDWSWPTHGEDSIDFGCLVLQMIAAGWTPGDAERLIEEADCAAWRLAKPEALDAFAAACASMYRWFEETDPAPWRKAMTQAAAAWLRHRTGQR